MASESSSAAGTQDNETADSDVRHVLIVDDHPEIHAALESFLAKHNFLVTLQSDGSAGIRWARSHKPDIILLDIEMPVMDGIKALYLLRNFSETRRIPVLMLTARSDQKSVEEAVSLGVRDYVTKPYNLTDMLARIQQVLAESK